jgi:hypothetical protein
MLLVADPAAASSILVKGPGYVPRKPFEYTAFDVVSTFSAAALLLCCGFKHLEVVTSCGCGGRVSAVIASAAVSTAQPTSVIA